MTASAVPVVRSGEDRRGAPFRFVNGQFDTKVSPDDTGGGLFVIDTWRTEPGGPPLHVHHDVDEWFCVLSGRFRIRIGGVDHELGPDDSVLGPRGLEHAFASLTPTARLLIAFTPAGSMEAFFREGAAAAPLSPADFAALSAAHGMTVTGPPLPLS
ncbi:cupin domain-containing protein [Rhodobacterales bacterium HKCCE2091]|nr:cupin domain-containing protein [Rhodobacterales bacterium HKCCE2091]